MIKIAIWNPWHGCHKISPGCKNCYVYRQYNKFNQDSSIVVKNKSFNLPIEKYKNGNYKIPSGELIYTCLTSDFFVEDANPWRQEAFNIINERSDLQFLIITKRIDRFTKCIPNNYKNSYDNLSIACTVENQEMADYRLPIFLKAPIKHKYIVCEPLLEKINLLPYLNETIEKVIVGGESGPSARLCNYDWILDIKKQCKQNNISFHFKQTGANFKKDGKKYIIKRKYQHSQAKKANINFTVKDTTF